MSPKARIILNHPADLEPSDYATFVEIDPFPRQWDKLGMVDQDLHALQIAILVAQDQTPVIPEGGGLRKIRFSKLGSSKGKRGSYRVFYAYFFDHDVVLLLSVLGKGDREDISRAELHGIAAYLRHVEAYLKRGVGL
jgi:hypothetical protein